MLFKARFLAFGDVFFHAIPRRGDGRHCAIELLAGIAHQINIGSAGQADVGKKKIELPLAKQFA